MTSAELFAQIDILTKLNFQAGAVTARIEMGVKAGIVDPPAPPPPTELPQPDDLPPSNAPAPPAKPRRSSN